MAGVSGHSNIRLTNVFNFAKANKSSPLFTLGRERIRSRPGCALQKGDLVGVWVDPQLRCVRFYLNGQLLLDSAQEGTLLPECDGTGYGIYVLVDDTGDRVEIESFGYGEFNELKAPLL